MRKKGSGREQDGRGDKAEWEWSCQMEGCWWAEGCWWQTLEVEWELMCPSVMSLEAEFRNASVRVPC